MQYQISDAVLARPLGEAIVLFHSDTEQLLTLEGSAPRIWELLAEERDPERIVARLLELYDGSEAVIRREVLEFLEHLESQRILHRVQ